MKMETTAWDDNGRDRFGLCAEGGGDMIAAMDASLSPDEQLTIAKQIAAQSLGLFAQIEASAQIDNLDDAVRPIQDILGQTDGGHASMFFSDKGWDLCSTSIRRFWLIRYAVYELGMLEMAQ